MSDQPERQEITLSSDQFEVDENGQLIVDCDDVRQAMANAQDAANDESGSVTVGVSVTI